jgi:hypothetical protein
MKAFNRTISMQINYNCRMPRMLQRRATISSPDKADEALVGLKRSKNLNSKQNSGCNNRIERKKEVSYA